MEREVEGDTLQSNQWFGTQMLIWKKIEMNNKY